MVTLPVPLAVREVKVKCNFLAIAGNYTRLRRSGRQFVGLCPLHSERHRSFYVDPGRRVFHCFGCGAGGDVFRFVMLAEGCDFLRSVQFVDAFCRGEASESGPRSGPRFRASEGASPGPAKPVPIYSHQAKALRARILAGLEAADRRMRAIDTTNRKALAALATACEPERNFPLLLESKS
jgi:DNA primase